ncbi:MAG: flagellar basal body P-ring protein FlgI [Krumholzibacteria bacterium]|nr:flagellar basal body P-ring protein FlgI [Candidatus Krumholzibacteria bacterium]
MPHVPPPPFRRLRGAAACLAIVLLAWLPAAAGAAGTERIKDLALLEGTAEEPLVGVGLVLGLNGTGDGGNSQVTVNALANLLEKLDMTVDPNQLKAKNVAIVTVTASLDPNASVGSRVDVTVTSLYDASSLEGGTLVMTPLKAVDGTICVLAQGAVSIGGFNIKTGAGNSFRKNHAQVGLIPGGGTVKAPLGGRWVRDGKAAWLLNNPDFATASNVAAAINAGFGEGTAVARSAQRVEVVLSERWRDDPVSFVARMGEIEARHDAVARVVVNERTGTIIVGKDVHLREAAVAHGTLKVVINTYYNVSQPSSFSNRGETVVTPEVNTDVQDQQAQVLRVPDTSTVADVVGVLNDIGASPRDIIAILEALKRAGSLQAELVLM